MESFGAFLDQEWDQSLTNMFSFDQDSYSSLQQFASSDYKYNINNNNHLFFPCDLPIENPVFYSASQESTTSSELETDLITSRAIDSHSGGFFHQDTFEPVDFILPTDEAVMEEVRQLEAEMWFEKLGPAENNGGDSMQQLKRKFVEIHAPDNILEHPMKLARASKEADKRKRNPRSKKSKKSDIQTVSVIEQVNNNAIGSSTACSSEDELTNGKSKAGKGPATDPQSIYARKRRERINERLKILQTLVPNGTKVDISTMLEEAVDYVKFLQLQIKVLSSDDMWMYAPIAYNGMDMGLYQKILPNL